jgi:hypothetical protein
MSDGSLIDRVASIERAVLGMDGLLVRQAVSDTKLEKVGDEVGQIRGMLEKLVAKSDEGSRPKKVNGEPEKSGPAASLTINLAPKGAKDIGIIGGVFTTLVGGPLMLWLYMAQSLPAEIKAAVNRTFVVHQLESPSGSTNGRQSYSPGKDEPTE